MLKKEVILEGLDCANCAAKIEDEVNKLNGVKAYMNFMNKTLTLEIESEQEYKNILQQVKTIVHKHEPDVVVKEKSVNKSNKKVLILEGLGCANCAAKMEKEISGLEGVEFAAVDFVSKKLTLEISPKVNRSELNEKIEGIVKKIEPDVVCVVLNLRFITGCLLLAVRRYAAIGCYPKLRQFFSLCTISNPFTSRDYRNIPDCHLKSPRS
jgi:Cd2+/Zn2+-exporting ATPase